MITRRTLLAAMAARPKTIRTLVGTGMAGYSDMQIANPYGLAIGPDGALYVCEIDNCIVRRVDLKTRKMTTVAGSGKRGYAGDGSAATKAETNEPYEVRFDRKGNLFFVEMKNHLIRRVDRKTGVISTVAGTGEAGFSGDGGDARRAAFRQPHSIQFAPDGSMLVCDIGNHRIRRIDLEKHTIDTWAGTGEKKPTPDGGKLGKDTPLNGPRAIDIDPKGNLYLALREGNAVYRIDGRTLQIEHIAGTGKQGYAGDGGDARQALLAGPKGIAWSPDGGVYIADTESHTVRRIDLTTRIITTVAGTGQRGDGPDGDPRGCKMARPHGVFVDKRGVLYIGDSEAHRVRVLS